MSVRFIITFTSSVFAALLGSLVFVSFLLARNQGELEASEERRHQSYKLADELRQTSDDLTRLARTYVVTGDPVFEGYFQEVIRIRNGEAPRPDHYDGIYWDFVLATGRRQGSSEGPVALEVLMKRMHFTEEEFLKLKESKAKSDALVHLEEKAMNAVKGRFNDAEGEPPVVREPDLEMARGLVFGKEYHQAKAEIMKPISEFMVMLEERTEREVRGLQKNRRLYGATTLGLAAGALGFTFVAFLVLYRRVMIPVRKLVVATDGVKAGRYGQRVDHSSADELGNLASSFNHMTSAIEDDIAERKRIEEELHTTEFLSDIALELTHCGYWHVDYSDPDYYYQSERAARMLGEPNKPDGRYHLQDEWFARLVEANPETAEHTAERYEGAIDGRYAHYESTYAYKRPIDGAIIWLHALGKVVRDENDRIRHMYGVYQDVTLRVANEKALQEATHAAEAATHAKSEFLSHMSHELRTPLNGVLGYAQILQRDRDTTDGQKQNLKAIVSCGDHLLALINDVLDLSKIEAGRMEVDEAPCDLHKLIQGVGDVVRQRAQGKSLTFETEVSPEVPQGIVTDAGKLRQILVNLLGNAVKFTADGGVTLHVVESPKGRLRFDVIDTGVGMSEEEMADIFDPFKQVEAGRTAGGTGLGLAITQRLAERLGGDIEVTSEKGTGSTFTVELPLVEAPTEDLGTLEAEGVLDFGEVVLAPGQKCTVLVADDREANRDILDRMLEAAGITALIADDGDTALEAMREHDDIDLVLMDVRMPRLNGIEAVKQIRADDGLKEAKVIAVTASVFPEFREKAIEAGFDDFLGKPFRTEELMEKLKKHLDLEFESAAMETPAGVADDAAGLGDVQLPAALLEKLKGALKIKNLTAINRVARS